MTKQTFIKGAMILLAAGILNRLLGFIPRIALPRIIGAEGVGLYQLGYPFLIVMITIITGGIPIAIAKWTAEAQSQGDTVRVKQIFRTALALTSSLAILFTGLSLLLASWITTHILTDSRVYYTFIVMTPMLLITAVSAVYRGYYQGKQNMVPTALSQTVETIFRIVFVLLFAKIMLPWGVEWAAAGAMLGVVVGELFGLFVLLIQFARDKKKEEIAAFGDSVSKPETAKPVLGRLLGLSVPVTLSKMVGSLSYLLESILTARSLALAGIATGIATAQYGALQGMIIPIVLLPTALTYSLSVSLIPSLSEAAAKGDRLTIHKRLHQSMRLSLVCGAPFVVIMALLAEPIVRILYHHADIAPMLQLMAPIAIFIYMQAPLQAALQALEKPGTALLNTFIGAAVKIILIVQLASNPSFGIYGALIAINVNTVLVTLLHYISVRRLTGFHMKLLDFIKVGAAMVIMGASLKWTLQIEWLTREWQNVLAACGAGALVYLLLMAITGIVNRDDLSRLPLIRRWLG
ncbi:stage V sporulation protein B [Paenibacillus sp. GCM10012307]|uniref:Stage V sporulation protein B n=1 Tax=Paenibacillus roseus TaxID=2798579 RepID=A0A934J189_9BACL|nr:stage V sporulation protein B [Paenibacillus roseus]